MGAGASTSYELTSAQKADITRTLDDKYRNIKAQSSEDEKFLYESLKSTFHEKVKSIQASEPAVAPPQPAGEFNSISQDNVADVAAPVEAIPAPPVDGTPSKNTPSSSRRARSNKSNSFTSPNVQYVEDDGEADEGGYEFSIRNSVAIKPGGSIQEMISKIEGPGKLLKAKTSSQLLSMVDDSVLDDHAKIAAFIEQLKAGTVQTKTKTEFRQRRLTYSTQTVSDVPAHEIPQVKHNPSPEKRHKNRTTIFASSEIGVVQEKQPPFPNEILGTYSCHGIEPAPDEEDGIHEKINQDRGCIVYPYNNKRNEALLMVLDGHGEHGDKVSEFVMRQIVVSLEKDPLLNVDPTAALKNAYITTNTALLVTDIHYMTSGCTCVTVYVKGNKLYVANAGDSRAVMACRAPPGTADAPATGAVAKDLTRDHKPDDLDEQRRIESWGGFVCPPHEEGLSSRVYLDAEFTMIGLAMSRSIGDHAVKNVGVIAEPEVKVFDLEERDMFMIMASDGVWEFISSQEAVDIVSACFADGVGTHDTCQELIETAACRWQEEEGDYRDDITAIVVKFPLPNFVDVDAQDV